MTSQREAPGDPIPTPEPFDAFEIAPVPVRRLRGRHPDSKRTRTWTNTVTEPYGRCSGIVVTMAHGASVTTRHARTP